MAIPKAVQDQSDAADAQIAEAQGAMDTAHQAQEPAQEPSQIASQDGALQNSSQQNGETVSLEEYNKVRSELEKVKQSYVTLQGKYSAEMPRMAEEIRELRKSIADLSKVPAAPAEPAQPPHLKYVKKEEAESLDPNALDLQGRIIKGVVDAEGDRLRTENRDIKAQLDNINRALAETKSRSVWGDAEKAYPGITAMDRNMDPTWVAFLGQEDELSGLRHGDIGSQALSEGNSSKFTALVKKFMTSQGVSPVNSSVASQVKPSTSRASGEAAQPKQPRTFKESFGTQIANEISKGIWKGREKEAQKLLSDFEDALIAGKVILGQ